MASPSIKHLIEEEVSVSDAEDVTTGSEHSSDVDSDPDFIKGSDESDSESVRDESDAESDAEPDSDNDDSNVAAQPAVSSDAARSNKKRRSPRRSTSAKSAKAAKSKKSAKAAKPKPAKPKKSQASITLEHHMGGRKAQRLLQSMIRHIDSVWAFKQEHRRGPPNKLSATTPQGLKDQLQAVLEHVKRSDKVLYKQKKGTLARMYSPHAVPIQHLPRVVRNALAQAIGAIDLDFVKCNPSIAAALAQRLGSPHHRLLEFCEHYDHVREEHIDPIIASALLDPQLAPLVRNDSDEVMEAKDLVNAILNNKRVLSGKGFVGLNKVMTTECWFRKLIDNIDALKRAVQRAFEQGQVPFLTKEETAILKTPCYTVKKTGKLMNFLVNLWPVLHSIENKALLSMIKALRKAGFDLCLPVYDGGLVVKPGVDAATLTQEMESLLPQIEQAILDDTQVPMKLKIKGLDPAWISPDPDNGDDADDDVDDDADGDDEMEVAADDQGKPGLDTDRPTYPPGYQKSFPGNLFTYPTDPVTTFQHDELAKFVMDELSRQLRFHFRTDTLYVFKEESKLWRALSGPTMYMGELMELVSHLCPPLTYYIDENNVQKYRDKIGSIHTLQSVAETIKNKIKFHRQAGPAEDMQLERDFAMIGCMPLLGNRVLDLRTGLTRTRTQSDFFTTELPVQLLEHDQVDHEWTQAYIKSLLGTDDDHYVRVFCEAIGYMFTGEFDLKYFFMFVGPADSGKSLLISLLRDMLGDDWFLAATDPKVIVKGAESAHNAELVPLIGKRGAAISELEACQKFNESRLKALVSGEDAISVRGCGEAKTHLHYFRIVLLMMTNHVPKFDDHALASRLRVFAFPNRFARSSDKKAEIKSHINDLFYYFVQGAKQYYANGRQLSPCPQVDAATQRIVDSKCTVLNWFAESEFTFDPCNGKEVRKLDLFGSYQKWCRDPANRDLITKELGRTSFYERVVEIFQPMFDAGKQNEQLVFHNRGDKTFRGFQLRNQD